LAITKQRFLLFFTTMW